MVIRQLFALKGKTRAWVCAMSVLGLLMLAAPTFSQAASSRAKVIKTKKTAVVIKKQRREPVAQASRSATPRKLANVDREKTLARGSVIAPRASFGQLAGLHLDDDALDLKSSVALVIDQDTSEVCSARMTRQCCRSHR
jgi:hypothetical protein